MSPARYGSIGLLRHGFRYTTRCKTRRCLAGVRTLIITCQGEPITKDELFQYSGGQFLIDNQEKCQQRQTYFNLDNLCATLTASGPSSSAVKSINKLSGISSIILFVTKEDETELVVKIPYSVSGPPKLATASEVATMAFLKQSTTIPVPKVYDWSSTASNPIGAEYIIMEKVLGQQLYWVWDDLDLEAQAKIIKSLVEYEIQLAETRFPAYGSLYPNGVLKDETSYLTLDKSLDPSQSLCLGPSSCNAHWGESTDFSSTSLDNHSPLSFLSEYGIYYAQKEIRWLSEQSQEADELFELTSQERSEILEKSIQVMIALEYLEPLKGDASPTLWRRALEMGSIIVSEQDPTTIAAILDWRGCDIKPFFLQAEFIRFLQPQEGYKYGHREDDQPRLPDDFPTMTPAEQEVAKSQLKLAKCTKVYEMLTKRHNPRMQSALVVPSHFNLYEHIHGSSRGYQMVLLESCLIRLYKEWSDLELKLFPTCPVLFSAAEMEMSETRVSAYNVGALMARTACEALDTNQEGFLQLGVDLEEAKKANQRLFNAFLESGKEEALARFEDGEEHEAYISFLKKCWPFKEGL